MKLFFAVNKMDEYIAANFVKLQVVNVNSPADSDITFRYISDNLRIYVKTYSADERRVLDAFLYSCRNRRDDLYLCLATIFYSVENFRIEQFCGKSLMQLKYYYLPNRQQYIYRNITCANDLAGINPAFAQLAKLAITHNIDMEIESAVFQNPLLLLDDAIFEFISDCQFSADVIKKIIHDIKVSNALIFKIFNKKAHGLRYASQLLPDIIAYRRKLLRQLAPVLLEYKRAKLQKYTKNRREDKMRIVADEIKCIESAVSRKK